MGLDVSDADMGLVLKDMIVHDGIVEGNSNVEAHNLQAILDMHSEHVLKPILEGLGLAAATQLVFGCKIRVWILLKAQC
jgi:hypothetical protein